MNKNKDENLKEAELTFSKNSIYWNSFNNGLHWKIGPVNFYPTTHKWSCEATGEYGQGINTAIAHINKPKKHYINKLTVPDLVRISRKAQPQSLMNICEAIHAAIYK